MKALVSILLILVAQTSDKKEVNNVLKDYEDSLKTVALNFEKKCNFKRGSDYHKLSKTKYFKITPPKYEIRFDTIDTFDPSKFKKEMSKMYEVSQEHILLKKGGYRWISENSKINYCENEMQFELLKKNQLRLKYQKEPDEYGIVYKLTINQAPNHTPIPNPIPNPNPDTEKERIKQNLKVKELAKAGRIKLVVKREILISNGTIQEISLKEIRREHIKREYLLSLEKGNWKISSEKKVEQQCEANTKNIQICLRRLGYDTNIDGENTLQFKQAKYLFLKDLNLPNAKEEVFLRALGW